MGRGGMSEAAWRYTMASVVGTSHTKVHLPCQDASACFVLHSPQGETLLAAVASDGAGSASRSDVGSRVACDFLMESIAAYISSGQQILDLTRGIVEGWLSQLQDILVWRADAEGCTRRDYACTLLAAIVGADSAAFFQIGDGVMVVSHCSDQDDYAWVFWPQKGEYENVTHFVTDDGIAQYLEFALVPGYVEEIAVLTDGLERMALDYSNRVAYAPFFGPMFAPVRASTVGFSGSLSVALGTFLSSPLVNERTDDDKTLILVGHAANRW
jgi:hypothetical protein